jgi:hypothetical protein
MKTRIPALTTALAFCCAAVFADAIAKPGITPIQAELMVDVHAHLLKVGQTVYARVTVDWRGPDCVLRNGAILEAHVISVVPHTKTIKGSEVDLAFTKAQCGELEMGDFELLLAAMAAPPQNIDLGIISDPMPFNTSAGGRRTNIDNMRSSFGDHVDLEATISQVPLIPRMRMGDVSGIRGVKLSVGTGPDNSSVLTSKDHDVTLERHTLFLLVPVKGTFPRLPADPVGVQPPSATASGPSGAAPSNTVAAVPAPPPVDEIDICTPPQCNVALPAGNASDTGSTATSISIGQLGYTPRPQRVMNNFDHDEALAYLGPKELLVAFNPHILLPRHRLGRAGSTVRVIRAALVDTETRLVTNTVDWELPDNGQYLWPLAGGRVLVHVGSELRVYGEGLKIQSRVSIDGPLAFVRVTPDGSFIAVGVIRERHTAELHAQLSQSLESDPEEDVDVLVLNRNFESIAKSTARSDLMPPTLLNEGQARLLALPNMRYRISMLTWGDAAWPVVQFESSCMPELSTLAPDLILLVTCDKRFEGREYRVLRSNGKLALKGIATLTECGHAAEGSADQEAFVVKIVQSSRPLPPGVVFRAADFSAEELGVYRARDGKRLLRVTVGSPSSSREGFALAPDDSQLAVLTRDQIAVFSVPRE